MLLARNALCLLHEQRAIALVLKEAWVARVHWHSGAIHVQLAHNAGGPAAAAAGRMRVLLDTHVLLSLLRNDLAQRFPALPKISVDYAIMEKARSVETLVAKFDWDDVGLWTALPKHLATDAEGTSSRGAVVVAGASNTIAISNGRMIALCGVKDLVVVETADAILVCHRDAVQNIKQIVGKLPKELL
jgi:mannose-1-phosphate guanylyltransferase